MVSKRNLLLHGVKMKLYKSVNLCVSDTHFSRIKKLTVCKIHTLKVAPDWSYIFSNNFPAKDD